MSKHDVDIAKIRAGSAKFESVMATASYIIGRAATLGAIWLVFDGLNKIIADRDAATINAITKLVSALRLGSVLGYVAAILCSVGWYFERQGKKRAIREKSRYQSLVERNDPYHTSSGLTATGETPTMEDRG